MLPFTVDSKSRRASNIERLKAELIRQVNHVTLALRPVHTDQICWSNIIQHC